MTRSLPFAIESRTAVLWRPFSAFLTVYAGCKFGRRVLYFVRTNLGWRGKTAKRSHREPAGLGCRRIRGRQMGSGGRGEQGRFAASNRRRSIGVMDEGCAGIPLLSMVFPVGEGKARWHFYRFRACPWAFGLQGQALFLTKREVF